MFICNASTAADTQTASKLKKWQNVAQFALNFVHLIYHLPMALQT